MLLRLAYLGVTNTFAMLRLLLMRDRDKDVESLALRHQITVLQRQLGKNRVRFAPADRALLAALLHQLRRNLLRVAVADAPGHHAALAPQLQPRIARPFIHTPLAEP